MYSINEILKFQYFCGWVSIIFLLNACNNKQAKVIPLTKIYDKYSVSGGFLLQSLNDDKVYVYNEEKCQQGFLPASTFKIVSSIAALENGVVSGANHLMKWDSMPRQLPVWNQDHTLRSAFQTSCVPCFQELVAAVGVEDMQAIVQQVDYGRMDIQANNLTDFWLKGRSVITPYEQLDFLNRLANSKLPIKPSTYHHLSDIMTIVEDPNGITMKGKTGMAIHEQTNIGWFVGIIERADNERFIFVNIITAPVGKIPEEQFMQARKKTVGDALKELGVI